MANTWAVNIFPHRVACMGKVIVRKKKKVRSSRGFLVNNGNWMALVHSHSGTKFNSRRCLLDEFSMFSLNFNFPNFSTACESLIRLSNFTPIWFPFPLDNVGSYKVTHVCMIPSKPCHIHNFNCKFRLLHTPFNGKFNRIDLYFTLIMAPNLENKIHAIVSI